MEARGRRRWACAVVGAAGLALAITGSGASGVTGSFLSSGATLDQSYPSRPSACRYTGWVPDDTSGWAAQTFTAGVSGSLADVVVWLRASEGAAVSAAIAPVDAGGQPVVATPLASTSLTLPASGTYLDVDVSFPAPARVEAGKQYAIVLSTPAGATVGWTWKADLGSSTTDPSGTRCADGAYAAGRFWVSSAPIGADADFFFQTYVVPARHVTVAPIGTGSGLIQDSTRVLDCGSTCSGDFLQGETVMLTATPDRGSIFSGWFGDGCAGTTPTCSVTVNADISVLARFTMKLVNLTVHTRGRGTVNSVPPGITCGRRCSHGFVPGPVELTAKPSRGWQFARWQGSCRGTRPVCRLALRRASAVTAFFARTRHGKP